MASGGTGGGSANRTAIIIALITAAGVIIGAIYGPQIVVNNNIQQVQATTIAQSQGTIVSLQSQSTPTQQIIEVTRIVTSPPVEVTQVVTSPPVEVTHIVTAVPIVEPTGTPQPLTIAVNKEVPSSYKGVTLLLSNIEATGQKDVFRWYFNLKNTLDDRVCLLVDQDSTYISNNASLDKYPILDTSLAKGTVWVQPKTKEDFWFDFAAPSTLQASDLSVVFKNTYPMGWIGCNPIFDIFKVSVPAQ